MGKGPMISFRFEVKPGRSFADFEKLLEKSGKTKSQFIKDKIFVSNNDEKEHIILAMIEQFLIQNIEFTNEFPDSLWEIIQLKYINIAIKRIMERKKN